jgi:hypothetical protein
MIASYPSARKNQAVTTLLESSQCQRVLPFASNWSYSLSNVAHRCRWLRSWRLRHNDGRTVNGGSSDTCGAASTCPRFVTTMSRCTSTRGKEGPDLRQEAGPAFFSRDVTRSIAKRSSSRSIGLRMTGIEPRPARWSGGAAVTAMTGIEASAGSLCWRR